MGNLFKDQNPIKSIYHYKKQRNIVQCSIISFEGWQKFNKFINAYHKIHRVYEKMVEKERKIEKDNIDKGIAKDSLTI